MIKIKSINKNINYYGFEPNFNCLQYVQYLVKLNELKKVELLSIGLSNETKLNKLNAFGETDTRGSLADHSEASGNPNYSIWIPTMKLDDIYSNFLTEGASVLKIDVEGLELEVLKGSRKFIHSCSPILIFEVLPHLNNEKQKSINSELQTFLNDLGYKLLSINTKDGSLKDIDSLNANFDDYSIADYLAIPNKLSGDFKESYQ